MNKYIIGLILILVVMIGAGVYFFNQGSFSDMPVNDGEDFTTSTTTPLSDGQPTSEKPEDKTKTVIGMSVEKREITAYHYGEGETNLLFIGGIHGGYSWNTVLLAYELMDYLEENPTAIPDDLKVTVIPVLNPDGLNKVVGTDGRFVATDVSSSQAEVVAGRFNANKVDLNRNFDCDWQATSKWQNKTVSGGSEVFSEPESQAIRDYAEAHKLSAVVSWYSAVGGVYASNCHDGVMPETLTITNTYAKASGYPAYKDFNFYEITGDMINWFAKNEIPAISVLLTTHKDVEWTKNKAGIEALFKYYTK